MADPKGDFLYVNLPAAQVRRRLKGFGHGVRKIQSAGRNRAVVIHSATGRHLAELEAKFADVGSSRHATDLEEPIENLRNLGPKSGAWLQEAGISTIGDLERMGPVVAFACVQQHRPAASLNLLWALAAGLKDRDWRELDAAEKQRLVRQLELLRQEGQSGGEG